MAKNPGAPTKGRPARRTPAPARPAASSAPVVAAPAPAPVAKPRIGPAQFAREVRAETRKITWPSWKETWITSVMVFIMVVVTSVFFLLVDGGLSFLIQQLLKLA
ncbi:MAG: preprotein translocase subunit SecE [Caulobacteraceae bacterium]